jgi:hypothetical protein
MNNKIGSDLRALFAFYLLATVTSGLLGMLYPSFIIRVSGLDPNSIPVMQQAGGLAAGLAVGAFLAMRAEVWDQVRVFAAAALVANVLSLLGAIYYVIILGVVTTGLVILLIIFTILTAGFAYAWWKYDRVAAVAMKSA